MNKNPSPYTIINSSVLQNLKNKFFNYSDTPFCFVEISHRSRFYDNLNNMLVDTIKKYFNADGYEVLLMPSGSAMSSIFFNIVEKQSQIIFYENGQFSNKYYQQMKKYHKNTYKIEDPEDIQTLSSLDKKSQAVQIIQLTRIEQGIQRNGLILSEQDKKNKIIVNNINYCFPWNQTQPLSEDIVYFESQAGFSIPGFTVMMIRKQVVNSLTVQEHCPDMLDFLMMLKMKSVVNTPFTLCTLVLYENIKYALQNRAILAENVRVAKLAYMKMLQRAGFRLQNQVNEQKAGKEAFNFVLASYSSREEHLVKQMEEYGWVNKEEQTLCLFIQSENRKPFELCPEIGSQTQQN